MPASMGEVGGRTQPTPSRAQGEMPPTAPAAANAVLQHSGPGPPRLPLPGAFWPLHPRARPALSKRGDPVLFGRQASWPRTRRGYVCEPISVGMRVGGMAVGVVTSSPFYPPIGLPQPTEGKG